MRSYKVKPTNTSIFYDFVCPYCKFVHYKSKQEIEKWKFDICYCGAQIIYDVGDIKSQSVIQKQQIQQPQIKPVTPIPKPVYEKQHVKQIQSIPLKPTIITKKYDEKAYISLLQKLGMKVGQAKILIQDLIKMGVDPSNETLFTTKLLENLK
jgi:hypothetical protein